MSRKRKPQLPKAPAGSDLSPRDILAAEQGEVIGPEQRAERAHRLVDEGARLLAARRPGEAAALLTQAWALAPNNAAAAINLGGAYILQGKHARAIPALEAATRLEPDNPMVWTNLAAAYLGKLPFATREQQDRAIAAFERALALNPRTPHAHYNLGLIYLERDDPAHAAPHFQRALETDPTDRDAQQWLDRISRKDDPLEEPQG